MITTYIIFSILVLGLVNIISYKKIKSKIN
ncbi:hypothetical protein CPT_Madawaska_252 [Staphylococcus phage Madawaska]|nr:hypothetical protein CPT_Madawaska_252 [Staphylococcus phage Madawaska]